MTPTSICRGQGIVIQSRARLAVLMLVVLPMTACGQPKPTAVVKNSVQAKKPAVAAPKAAVQQVTEQKASTREPVAAQPVAAEPVAAKPPEKQPEPASVEEAERVLDLRTFPMMEGAKVSSIHSLGMLLYEAKGTPKEAFEFQRQELLKRGFKELPGGYIDAQGCSGKFTKDGFLVTAGASARSSEPEKSGWSSVSLVNDGNVDVSKLPVPPGAKPFHPTVYEASYTTAASPTETTAACRKLLLEAGWEPYGGAASPHPDQPDASLQYFKRNAIKLESWIMTTPVDGGKTLIRYSTDLLTADLPASPDAADPRFDMDQKKLWFESPAEKADAIIAFYQERLPKQGWKATTEKPIVDDQNKSQFLVYRNAQKDMISLDLNQYSDKVVTTLTHKTAAEVAEDERLAKEEAELARQQAARENAKVNVAVPLPALAEKLDKKSANEFEFTLPTGSGPETIKTFCEQLLKDGWKEQGERDLDETSGHIILKREYAQLTLSYFDLGISDVDITVEGTRNVVLDPIPSKDAAAALAAKKPKVDEIDELLKKAFQEAKDKLNAPPKKPAPKKAAQKKTAR